MTTCKLKCNFTAKRRLYSRKLGNKCPTNYQLLTIQTAFKAKLLDPTPANQILKNIKRSARGAKAQACDKTQTSSLKTTSKIK